MSGQQLGGLIWAMVSWGCIAALAGTLLVLAAFALFGRRWPLSAIRARYLARQLDRDLE